MEVSTVNLPPAGIASRALMTRFTSIWFSKHGSTRTVWIAGSSTVVNRMSSLINGWSMRFDSRMSSFRSNSTGSKTV